MIRLFCEKQDKYLRLATGFDLRAKAFLYTYSRNGALFAHTPQLLK